jgi:hypothetical protein
MDTPSIPIRKKKRYIPMIFAAGGWNANVLYVWATPRTVSVLGLDPVVTAGP